MQGILKFILPLSILALPVFVYAQNRAVKSKSGNQAINSFLNPILPGDYPDPSIMRDGKDYYMTHSSFDYVPGLTVFHSTDLVNWEPVSYALTSYQGPGWAPDICKYEGRYYIYFTVANKGNFVVYASSPKGPWSAPIDLKVGWIDPCHVADETGQRWLFLSSGHRIKLAADGLSTAGTLEKIYDGWKYPAEWETEGFALEGPKLKHIGKYWYMLSAEGGTSGPPTSHMIVVARSTTLNGPWENAPGNPLIHTYNRSEKWWSKGHGSLIDAPDGKWYIVYHAYENGYYNLGRQSLLEPVQLTGDGWLKAPTGTAIEKPLAKPLQSGNVKSRLSQLNKFRIGLDWRFYRKFDSTRFAVTDNVLTLKAQGKTPHESAPLLFIAGAHDYEFSVKIDKDTNVTAGLVLFYNNDFYVGTGFDDNERLGWRKGAVKARVAQKGKHQLWLKIRNNNNIMTAWYSENGKTWQKEGWAREISGYHHNVLYDFISILPGLFAYGEGEVRFSDFHFQRFD